MLSFESVWVWSIEIVTDIRLHLDHPVQAIKRQLAAITNLEWILIAGIIAVLIALLAPQARWVSDGSIRLPVRVFVFDAADRDTPIANAKIAIFPGPVASEPQTLAEMQAQMVSHPTANE